MMPVALTDAPLDVATALASLADASVGATVLFIGTVRDSNEGRPVSGLEYSAYEAMAVEELGRIVTEVEAQWPGVRLVVQHRVGRLALGDASIVVAATHAHRGPAFDAAREALEAVKRRVPIWKREEYVDGTRSWVDPTAQRVPG